MSDRRHLVFVAPMLGAQPGLIPDVFERLGPLVGQCHEVTMASNRPGRLARAIDMVRTVFDHRATADLVVVHLYSGKALAVEDAVTRVARRAGVPLVGVLAGGGFPDFRRRHPRWVDAVLDRFDLLVAPSEHLGGWARDLGRTVRIIANPLDTSDYRFIERAVMSPRLFWMRAYHSIYRPFVALDVLEQVLKAYPQAHLTMAGPDKGEFSSVARAVQDRGLADSVDLLGFVAIDEKRTLFADHDIFLNTPAVDNRPVCLVEAAASGLPIVSTDAGGIPHLVQHGHSALLAPVDDAVAIARQVTRLLEDPELAALLASQARAVADEGRPGSVLEAWNAVVEDLVG